NTQLLNDDFVYAFFDAAHDRITLLINGVLAPVSGYSR
ncbi:MAG: hypothetical protein ACJAUE_002131, partial [Alcanivorax sp.]